MMENASMRMLLAMALTACASAVAAQASDTPRYVEDVSIKSRPAGRDIVRYYPDAMQRANASGAGMAECRVSTTGELVDCRVIYENPKAMGMSTAILGLSKTMQIGPKTAGGEETAGRYFLFPITLRVPEGGTAVPMPDYRAGRPAYVVTIERGKQPTPSIGCATAENPKQQCYLHELKWAKAPDFGTAAPYVDRMSRKTGRLTMRCNMKPDGALAQCAPSEPLTPADGATMGELLALYRGPAKADDGTATATGQVMMMFDWGAINEILAASALKQKP